MPDQEQKDTEAKRLWKKVLAELELDLSGNVFKMWVSRATAENLEEDSISLVCPTPYIRDQLSGKYFPFIKSSIDRVGKNSFNIKFIIREEEIKPKDPTELGPLFEDNSKNREKSLETAQKAGLSSRFTFDNYLMGKNNQLAYAIALAVAETPGKVYNPFFLYSGVGLGKTHLMQAIGNRIVAEKPDVKIVYCTGETFTNELIESLQRGKRNGRYTANEFRDKFRKADVLLIDDVQFIAGREATQEEFFHTFDALHRAQKQIVLTSDRPPKDFTNLEDRITSRFSSGIIADIQQPDVEMRTALLRRKRDENRDQVPNDVIDFIAEKINTNVRELEGAYLQVLTSAATTGTDINIEYAARALGQSIREEVVKKINLNQILKAVCNYYSVRTADLKGKKRTKDLVVPRQVTMYLIKEMTGTPYIAIGEFLGGRDHTTVMHGVDKIQNEVTEQGKVKQDITNVKQMIMSS
jgi:chromosomal replication initiator protein